MTYMDYRGFDRSYFEGQAPDVADPHPAGYSQYSRALIPFDYASEVADQSIRGQGVGPNYSIGVIGCAYGYSVESLNTHAHIDAYGLDISSYAVGQSPPGTPVTQGDVLDAKALRSARTGGPPDVVYNECVLECLTDSEAITAAENMRSEARQTVVHRVWSADGSDVNPDYYNDKTVSEWQSLVDPAGDDVWVPEEAFHPAHHGYIHSN